MVEKLYEVGLIRVLSCTSTLAWGVNLPAYAVVIKGTEIYADGNFVDLSVLDVQQIFGRAGRPQFDNSGEATIITTHSKLAHYVSLMIRATPIESQEWDSNMIFIVIESKHMEDSGENYFVIRSSDTDIPFSFFHFKITMK